MSFLLERTGGSVELLTVHIYSNDLELEIEKGSAFRRRRFEARWLLSLKGLTELVSYAKDVK
jgi:hypothetical protein